MTVTVINSGAAKDTLGTLTEFDITLGSLASSTAGVGRQSALIENTGGEREVRIYIKLKLGTSPTSARAAYVYLNETIEQFPGRSALGDELRAAGFTSVQSCGMTFGIVALHEASK